MHKVVAAAVETLDEAQDYAHDRLSELVPPEFELPQPEITADALEPLFDSNEDWPSATQKVIEHRHGNPVSTEPSRPLIRRPRR